LGLAFTLTLAGFFILKIDLLINFEVESLEVLPGHIDGTLICQFF